MHTEIAIGDSGRVLIFEKHFIFLARACVRSPMHSLLRLPHPRLLFAFLLNRQHTVMVLISDQLVKGLAPVHFQSAVWFHFAPSCSCCLSHILCLPLCDKHLLVSLARCFLADTGRIHG